MEEEEELEGEGKGCWRIRRRDQGRQATRWWSLVTGGWPARGEVPVSEPQVPGRVSWMTVSVIRRRRPPTIHYEYGCCALPTRRNGRPLAGNDARARMPSRSCASPARIIP